MKYKILVTGLVQGVGFRPMVAELAEACNLLGQVKNLGGMVEIIVSGETQAVEKFLSRLSVIAGKKTEDMMISGEKQMVEKIHNHRNVTAGKETGNSFVKGIGCKIGRIDTMQIEELEQDYPIDGVKFQIVKSSTGSEEIRLLPVDFPTCDRCRAELFDKNNRRYRYPFISCTNCGPRYSIQKAVPYDRDSITMDDFAMCPGCLEEYTKRGNIRRHAQTIACHNCGPALQLIRGKEGAENEIDGGISRLQKNAGEIEENSKFFGDTEEILSQVIHALKNDKIIAIKDIGGFHFAFSSMSSEAANRLRVLKHRDKKPFAVMFPEMKVIREFCEASKKEEELLTSTARPIVLLKKKKDFAPEICGESDRIGALLPCNPLQMLILEQTGPLVMTSGNRGGEPMIIREEEMKELMQEGCPDMILTHDREILTPLDDSIYQVNGRFVQLIRRARGLVPEPIELAQALKKDTFAAGGDLKAVFALGRGKMVYLSQYFGDLEDVRCLKQWEKAVERMEKLLEIAPERTIGDLHPAYVSAKGMEGKIQHHMAHVASVIAEHKLEGKVLGIACDGTGFGADGTIWGSEFFKYENGNMERVGHFSAVKLLGGDASAKEADKTLFSYWMEAKERGLETDNWFFQDTTVMEYLPLQGIDSGKARIRLQEMAWKQNTGKCNNTPVAENLQLQEMAWKQNINTVRSSSMGRLFDAVSALLDICHYNSYEGECAIMLERAAHAGWECLQQEGHTERECFHQARHTKRECLQQEGHIEVENLLEIEVTEQNGVFVADSVKLLADLAELKKQLVFEENWKEILAYLFHHAVAKAMISMAKLAGEDYRKAALSGGSFINRILLKEVAEGLENIGWEVYTNEKIPCGDGGIALGQVWLSCFEEGEFLCV